MNVRPISTTAPMPTVADLFSGAEAGIDALVAPWVGASDQSAMLSRASWAIRAIVDGHAETSGKAPRLWIPDYFCDSALTFVRETPTPIVLYPVCEDLEPDWTICERMAVDAPPNLFLQVHYFGWPRDLSRARAFCNRHGAALIEDAAHALAPGPGIGSIGDYTIWSLYKHLPLPDGALLVARRSALGADAVLHAARRLAARGSAWAGLWPLRRLVQRLTPELALRLRRDARSFDEDAELARRGDAAGISSIARRLAAKYSRRLSEITERRRRNEAAVRTTLEDCGGLVPAFPPPPPGIAPYRAVFRADSTDQARFWYEAFTQFGNAVETWPDLPQEVRKAPDRHRGALALRQSCFGLPVHADHEPQELAAAYGPACAANSARRARALR